MYEMIKAHMTQNIPFAGHAFVTIDEIGPGHATAHIEDVNEVKNHINTIHTGALFTLAETASGAAMAGTLGERLMQLRPVAKDASIGCLMLVPMSPSGHFSKPLALASPHVTAAVFLRRRLPCVRSCLSWRP